VDNLRILAVDDTPLNLQLIKQILGEDYQLVFSTNGEKALELAAQNPPDLILLDIRMPGMDGFEVCRRIKGTSETRHIPVLFISATDFDEDINAGFDAGADDFVLKPINPLLLRRRVATYLRLSGKTPKTDNVTLY